MNKKLIAIDLDGTTLESRTTIHPFNIKVLKEIKKLGHQIVIATGRPWRSTKEFYDILELDTPVCNYNGAFIHNPCNINFKRRVVSIPKELVVEISFKLKDYIGNIMCEEEDKVFLIKQDERLDGFFWRDTAEVYIGEIDKILNSNPTTIIIATKDSKYNDIVSKYIEDNYPDYICRFWGVSFEEYAEIYPKVINKGEAILYIAEQLKIEQQDIIAYGDANNDFELLSVAHLGVAMSNGVERLHQIADEITSSSCSEGGLGKHLNNFFNLNINE